MRTSDAKAPVYVVPSQTTDVLDISGPGNDLAILEKVQFARVVMQKPVYAKEFKNINVATEQIKKWLALQVQEHVLALYLDASLHPVAVTILGIGNVSQARVNFYSIVQQATLLNVGRLILFHNHPSGGVSPSDDDCRMTSSVAEILKPFDIELVDHVIVGSDLRSFSFEKVGLLRQ